ncbi:histidine kinase [Pseudomonas sp. 3MA1]|uniref:ATP-binding protein n=1 Tax=Pseudomonas sp. 3MA1 TaxID=2699196 RepID=UPI0023DD77EB|nr:ATP-binding protein [Pseudomonas sp. 3MA1]MDF2395817.1 histidine kinase [Pseudomonas sp. 3MA1]
MKDSVPFQTRARTIDHLGREQIADVPTAVSELWKNAYDAYAKEVSLHIHDGEIPIAVIMDDGHGMTRKQFLEKWLVVGTDSKAGNESVPLELRQGLDERPKQGQKGIGRLSVAALGATALIISKQINNLFVASLIDWRLFENPFLLLHDVRLPVIEFGSISELPGLISSMQKTLVENITGSDANDDRDKRLISAWQEFDELVKSRDLIEISPSEQIIITAGLDIDASIYLKEWGAWSGEKESGTSIIISDLNPALSAWISDAATNSVDESDAVKASLIRTLSGFSDPYERSEDVLDYRVVVHRRGGSATIIERESGYGLDYLKSLDHSLIGEIDEFGIFRGRVMVFGNDIGNVEIAPSHPVPTSYKDKVGSFSFCIGAFEPIARSSSLEAEVHSKVLLRAESHSGLNVYRDGLRVMPYGRPESDFFKIEERRQFHAGREFWASRRVFGRIAISRSSNPNLRDKAGREGLIDNAASRAIQTLIVDLLKVTARRYFGTDAPVRQDLLPGVEAENDVAAAKAKLARSGQLSGFRKVVKSKLPQLSVAMQNIISLRKDLEEIFEQEDSDALWKLSTRIEDLQGLRSELRLPPKPKNLGKFEDRYREYRDQYSELILVIDEVKNAWALEAERLNAKPAIDVAKSRLSSNQSSLSDQLGRWKRNIIDLLSTEQTRIAERIQDDQKEFYKKVSPLLFDVEEKRVPLVTALAEMDDARDELSKKFSDIYEPYHRSLMHLSSGIDLDSAFAYAGARSETLENRLEQIQSLAQIGISVEILSHELHALDRRLQSSLDRFPDAFKATKEFSEANWARKELVERLRFLSQMQVSGSDIRQKITGAEIEEYLKLFFKAVLEENNILIKVTDGFRCIAFYEFPSRIFPVFINLINNSIYWLPTGADKLIQLDVEDDCIVVSDNGPGIDSDDVENLFELFFTRRIRGRGVGLYLCRQTLAAGGHTIQYVVQSPLKKLPGANFVIKLRNGFDA